MRLNFCVDQIFIVMLTKTKPQVILHLIFFFQLSELGIVHQLHQSNFQFVDPIILKSMFPSKKL